MGLAAQQGVQRIYSLSQDRMFSQSEFGVRVRSEIESRSQDIAAENRQIEEELKAEEQALTDQRASLSPADFRVLADAFDEKVETFRTTQARKTSDLNAYSESEQQRFFKAALPVIVTLAEELGATAILDERSTIIASDQMDITALAIEQVNKAIGDGTQTPQAPTEQPSDP